MPNRTLSTSVDERVAAFVDDLVKIEGKTPSQILASALHFYLQLPEAAHRAFRVVDSLGTAEERQRTRQEVVRALLNGEYAVARRQVARQLRTEEALDSEESLMEAAVKMVKAAR